LDVKVAIGGLDVQTLGAQLVQALATQQKVNIHPGAVHSGAKVAANATGSNHQNFHA
jgi:hypothetical protein